MLLVGERWSSAEGGQGDGGYGGRGYGAQDTLGERRWSHLNLLARPHPATVAYVTGVAHVTNVTDVTLTVTRAVRKTSMEFVILRGE